MKTEPKNKFIQITSAAEEMEVEATLVGGTKKPSQH